MTLPGLDDVARLAGLIAILFSASSMVSSVVALFRWKADVERTVVYVGGEGLTLLTVRPSLSLPLFLTLLTHPRPLVFSPHTETQHRHVPPPRLPRLGHRSLHHRHHVLLLPRRNRHIPHRRPSTL